MYSNYSMVRVSQTWFHQTLSLKDCNNDSIKISICLLFITKQDKVSLNPYSRKELFSKGGILIKCFIQFKSVNNIFPCVYESKIKTEENRVTY